MIRLQDMMNKTQYAFLIVKPGSLEHTSEILKMYEESGWKMARIRTTRLQPEQARELYSPHKNKDFFKDLVNYMCSGLSTGILITRPGNPNDKYLEGVAAIKDEVRKKWGESDMRNVLHSTDNTKRLKTESGIYF